ncbi:MAG: carbon monoxide dehydrogenase accessory protein CooC [Dehalococcoidales bacterium]|nr:carbon monoxide dehydrogenase accessory protein CooC [Dehalococcoidales bacterium]
MKIAISGKGGVGKTLLSAFLSKRFAESGYSVLAIDADPDASLATDLGFPNPEKIVPISEMKELVAERTGARPGKTDVFFKLNPKVDDLPEKYWAQHDGIKLMVMGKVKPGGSGCYCAENTLVKALISHLLLARNEVVIMDMTAGIEHLGRATARAVDELLVVVEPGQRSIQTALTTFKLASDIGIHSVGVVGNKVRNEADKKYIISSLPGFDVLGFLPYDQAIVDADISKRSLFEASPRIRDEVKSIYQKIIARVQK